MLNSKSFKLVASLILFLCATTAQALEPVILTESQDEYHLGPMVEYLMDDNAELTINQVSSPEFDAQFQRSTTVMTHLGGGSVRSGWVRFKLHNDTSSQRAWVLELQWHVQKFEIYERDAQGQWQGRVTGDTYPHSNREINYGFLAFRLDVDPGSDVTVYTRTTERNLAVPIRLMKSDAFDRYNLNTTMFNGAIFGLMGVMALYNLFLYFSLRDQSYLYYVLFVVTAVVAQSINAGILQDIVWSKTGVAYTVAAGWVFSLGHICHIRFTQTFLQTRQHTPRLHWALWVMIGLNLIQWVGNNLFDVSLRIIDPNVQGFIQTVIQVSALVIVLRKGYRPAIYYLASFLTLYVIQFTSGLSFNGVLPFDFFWSFNGAPIGVTIQVVLLSLGLADRINILRRERAEQETVAREAERRRIEVQEQAERKSAFFASMSHELRTPITSIKGYVDNILDGIGGKANERHERYLKRVTENSTYLLGLVNDLMDLSKIAAGKMDVDVGSFSVRNLIVSCCNTIEPLLQPGVTLIQDVADDSDDAHTDEGKLHHVIGNLLSNAVKFTEEGEIVVRTRIVDDQLEISVSDTGTGMPQEALETIFDEFQQVKGSDQKHKGTGLGLAITKQYTELLGGTVSLESEIGVGTTFTIQIPAVYKEA